MLNEVGDHSLEKNVPLLRVLATGLADPRLPFGGGCHIHRAFCDGWDSKRSISHSSFSQYSWLR